jgi:hypothetical protein
MATATGTTRKPAAAKAAPKVEAAPAETEQQIKNRLRNEAEREVIDRHRSELHEIAEAKFKAAGLVYTRRKSEQEKAADKIKALIEQFPELAGTFAGVAPVTPDADPAADPEWEDRKQAVKDIAAADGVHFVEAGPEYPDTEPDYEEEPPASHGWPADSL